MNQRAPLLFNPSRASFDELEKTFVGRWPQLEALERDLLADAAGPSTRHWQMIGPRGSGKSHFTELIGCRLRQNHKWSVVRLPEEHYQIGSVAELLEQIVIRLTESNRSPFVDERTPRKVEERALDWLRAWKREHQHPILVILENLGLLLERQLRGQREQSRLREILMREPPFILLATSTSYVDATVQHNAPFYDFFQTITLEDLSRSEVIELVEARARWDQDTNLLGQMSQVRPRVDAIFHFSGGNPRLVLALYGILRHGITEELHIQLLKLLDEVTPYYQARLNDISQQMVRVLTEMALAEVALTPAEIGRRTRMSTSQVTANINRLGQERFVRPGGRPDQRSRYYELTDRLFRLWMQMREGNTGRQRLRFLTEFFQHWYDDRPEELRHDAARVAESFWQELRKDHPARCTDLLTTLDYLESAFPRAQKELMLKELADALESAQPAELEQMALKLNTLLHKVGELSQRIAVSYALSLIYRAMELPERALAILKENIQLADNASTTVWHLYLNNIARVHGAESAYQEGIQLLERHPAGAGINENLCYWALQLGKTNDALKHLEAFLAHTKCANCRRRVFTRTILHLVGANQGKSARMMLDLARELKVVPIPELDFLELVIQNMEGVSIGADQMLAALNKWDDFSEAPLWALEHTACAIVHRQASAQSIEGAFDIIKLIDKRSKLNRWPDLLVHVLEILVRLQATNSSATDKVEQWMTTAGFGANAISKKFSMIMPHLARSAPLSPSVLKVYSRLRQHELLVEDIPPYSTALAVQNAASPEKALMELHPELREAVSLLLNQAQASTEATQDPTPQRGASTETESSPQ